MNNAKWFTKYSESLLDTHMRHPASLPSPLPFRFERGHRIFIVSTRSCDAEQGQAFMGPV